MNIFFLSRDSYICAKYHNDKHVVKMILEYAQLMSTAHRLKDNNPDESLYRITHKNHPCAIWTRESTDNYEWLYSLWDALLKEYTYRYEKQHASSRLLDVLKKLPDNMVSKGITEPALCMPDYCKKESLIDSYRNYYIKEKQHIAKWKYRDVPYWYNL